MSSAARPRVLLADPDDAIRVQYADGFDRTGCDVVEAADGRDALVKALVRPPSLVISEFRLPAIDGVALCRILRRDSATLDVPIIVMGTSVKPADRDRAHRAGAD